MRENSKIDVSKAELMFKDAQACCHGPELHKKEKAFSIFKELAIDGYADAQCCMGCLLRKEWENGREPSLDKSITWYCLSAKNGDKRAVEHMLRLAEELLEGKGGKRNPNLAFKLLKITSEYNERAIAIMAYCFENGIGTVKSSVLAQSWYDKIKLGKNAFVVGKMYFEGLLVNDFQKAFFWLEKAANMGDMNCLPYLAICYKYGLGVNANSETANILIGRASSEFGFRQLMSFYFNQKDFDVCCFLIERCTTVPLKFEDVL